MRVLNVSPELLARGQRPHARVGDPDMPCPDS